MGKYITSYNLWKNFGIDSYTKATETLTGSGTSFSLSHENVISGSDSISPAGYTMNYDNGTFTYTSSQSTPNGIYAYSDMPDSVVQEIINSSEEELDFLTGRNFDLTTTSEYLNVDNNVDFFLKNYPVISLTLSSNANSIVDTGSWTTLTQGRGNDYIADPQDLLIGKFTVINNDLVQNEPSLSASYVYGYSSSAIPSKVKELAYLLAQRKMINSTIYKAILKGRDNFTPVRLAEIENRIQELVDALKKSNYSRI
jgi:hypothetical protein